MTPNTPINANWADIVALFAGVESPIDFLKAVREAESLFSYEEVPLSISAELPTAEEIWLLKGGKLVLVSKYGEPVLE